MAREFTAFLKPNGEIGINMGAEESFTHGMKEGISEELRISGPEQFTGAKEMKAGLEAFLGKEMELFSGMKELEKEIQAKSSLVEGQSDFSVL